MLMSPSRTSSMSRQSIKATGWDITVDLTLANNVAELLYTARTAEAIETSALMLPMPTYDSNPSLPELTVKPKLAKDVTSAMEATAARRFAIKPMTLKDVLNTAIKDGIDCALK